MNITCTHQHRRLIGAAALDAAMVSGGAMAQAWPSKPISLIGESRGQVFQIPGKWET
jgi:hypothetical protein